MDNWLKGLIAAACVVVIGAGGYFVWSDRQERAEQERRMQAMQWQSICDLMLKEFRDGGFTQEWTNGTVAKCILEGHLNERDFDSPKLKSYLEQAKPTIEYMSKQTAK